MKHGVFMKSRNPCDFHSLLTL